MCGVHTIFLKIQDNLSISFVFLLLFVVLIVILIKTRFFKSANLKGKQILLVIAHPDDESM